MRTYWEKDIGCVDVGGIESEKEFGLIGRDVTRVHHIPNASLTNIEILLGIDKVKATINMKPGPKPVFCSARNIPLAKKVQVKIELAKLQAKGKIARIDAEGVMNASAFAWQRKKHGCFRLCADFKVQVNDRIMTEHCPLPDVEAYFTNWKSQSFMSRLTIICLLSKKLDDEAQHNCVINTTLDLCKLLRLPQGMKKASGKFQRTIENSLKRLVGTICFQEDVLAHGRARRQGEKRWSTVQDRLKVKRFTFSEVMSGYSGKITFLCFTFEAALSPLSA